MSNSVEGLKKIAGAKASRSGIWLKADVARYHLRVEKLMAFKGKNETFVAELFVKGMIPLVDLSTLKPQQMPNPVGSTASFTVNLSNDSGPGNVMAFICELLGCVESEATYDDLLELVSDSQP